MEHLGLLIIKRIMGRAIKKIIGEYYLVVSTTIYNRYHFFFSFFLFSFQKIRMDKIQFDF